MRWRPAHGRLDGTQGVEVEIVEDEHDDDVLDAMVAARASTLPPLAERTGVVGPLRVPGQLTALPSEITTPPDEPPEPRSRRPRLSPARRAGLAVLAVAVVAGVNIVDARRETARLAALAEVPGVVERLDQPLEELWTAPGYWRGQTSDLALIRGEDPPVLQGVDLATGAVLWTRPPVTGLAREVCPFTLEGEPGDTVGAVPGDLEPEAVVCVRQTGIGGSSGYGQVRIAVTDAGTGVDRFAAEETGTVLDVIQVEGTVVAAVMDPQNHLVVAGWDGHTGAERWRYRSAQPLVNRAAAQVQRVQRIRDVLLVATLDLVVGVDLTTGAEVDPETVQAGPGLDGTDPALRVTLSGGDVAVWSSELHRGHLEDAEGDVLIRLRGPVLAAPLDDGSAPDVLVTMSRERTLLLGVDRAKGTQLWASRGGGTPLLRVDGVLVVVAEDGDSVRAVDLRDGEILWTAPWESSPRLLPVTDGRVFLASVHASDGQTVLVGRSLADGTEVWRAPMPAGVRTLGSTRSGHVVGLSSDGVVGLGQPDARG